MESHALELVSQFCNYTDNPILFTLPVRYCDINVICEGLLDSPVNIAILLFSAIIIAGVSITVAWIVAMERVAGKLLRMTEREKIEYLSKYSSWAFEREVQQRWRREVEQQVVLAQWQQRKEAPMENFNVITL